MLTIFVITFVRTKGGVRIYHKIFFVHNHDGGKNDHGEHKPSATCRKKEMNKIITAVTLIDLFGYVLSGFD